MTTRTRREAPPKKIYGVFTFARLYAKWLAQSGGPRHFIAPDLPPEEANSLAASYIFFIVITLLMCALLPMEYYLRNIHALGVLLGVLLLCLVSCVYISITNKTTLPILAMAAYAYFMCSYFIWAGIVDADKILYYFWIVPLAIACLPTRLGPVLSLIFIVMIAVLFLPPVFEHMAANLDAGFRFRFLLAIVCIYLVSLMAEYYLSMMFRSIFAINRELEQYSLTDSLTGQGNRRNFINQFQRLHALQLRTGEPFTIIMADLDHFKKVNDTHGHLLGDQVLIFVAESLGRTLRGQDSLYRWGGEEFIVLLPGTRLEQGKIVAERMRKTLEAAVFVKEKVIIPITASFGVYAVGTAQPMHEHIQNTDTLLYQAKAKGRNCVVAADEGAGMIITMP